MYRIGHLFSYKWAVLISSLTWGVTRQNGDTHCIHALGSLIPTPSQGKDFKKCKSPPMTPGRKAKSLGLSQEAGSGGKATNPAANSTSEW